MFGFLFVYLLLYFSLVPFFYVRGFFLDIFSAVPCRVFGGSLVYVFPPVAWSGGGAYFRFLYFRFLVRCFSMGLSCDFRISFGVFPAARLRRRGSVLVNYFWI